MLQHAFNQWRRSYCEAPQQPARLNCTMMVLCVLSLFVFPPCIFLLHLSPPPLSASALLSVFFSLSLFFSFCLCAQLNRVSFMWQLQMIKAKCFMWLKGDACGADQKHLLFRRSVSLRGEAFYVLCIASLRLSVSLRCHAEFLFWPTGTWISAELFTVFRLWVACCEAALCSVDCQGKPPVFFFFKGGEKEVKSEYMKNSPESATLLTRKWYCSHTKKPEPFHCCPKKNSSMCIQLWRKFFCLFVFLEESRRGGLNSPCNFLFDQMWRIGAAEVIIQLFCYAA